jgi:HEAT repeat protein
MCLLLLAPLVSVVSPASGRSPKKPSVATLVGQLKTCKSLDTCAVVEAIVSRKGGFWPQLAVGLDAPDEMTRFWTLGVLSKAPVKKAIEAIAGKLGDPKIRVRAAAAYALGALRSKDVTPHLLRAVLDKDLNVRFAAVVAMGRVRDPATVDALLNACRDRDEDVRAYAVAALGDIGDKRSLPRLHERLEQDVHGKVRGFAGMALARFKDPTSVPVLKRRLKEEKDAKALAASIYALGEIGDATSADLIKSHAAHENDVVREYVARALEKLGTGTPADKAKKKGEK